AVDLVVAVAGLPAVAVEVLAEPRDVVPWAAGGVVEAVAAEQHVVAGAAAQDVVAATAVERQARERDRGTEDVVGPEAVDGQALRWLDQLHIGGGEDAEAADRDLVVAVRAVDGDASSPRVDLEGARGREVPDGQRVARDAHDAGVVELQHEVAAR